MQGLQAKINQQTINQVKAQWSNFVDELNKKNNVDINVNTTQLQSKLRIAVNNIDEALREYSKLGDVTAKNLVFGDQGQLEKFNIELERTKGIIETIKYSSNQIEMGNGATKNVFTVDNVNVLNKQKQLIDQATESQIKEEENAVQIGKQEEQNVQTLQLQYQQRIKNVEATAKELQNEEVFNKIGSFKNNLSDLSSTADKVGVQNLKNQYQDIVNLENQLIAKKKEEQKAVSDIFNQQIKEQESNDKINQQEDTKLKVLQMQWDQKIKNLQVTAQELNDEELFNKINNFQNNVGSTVSSGTVGQQSLKNEYQDIIEQIAQLSFLISAKNEYSKAKHIDACG